MNSIFLSLKPVITDDLHLQEILLNEQSNVVVSPFSVKLVLTLLSEAGKCVLFAFSIHICGLSSSISILLVIGDLSSTLRS